ncbi:hypothetical protein [Kitasatospora camelliae]|uniref:Uncharacterized protein n=1 Tax=Kitasatospora camelliae TaxID=3156397 RepID=A0AAU8K3X2_9ACTN
MSSEYPSGDDLSAYNWHRQHPQAVIEVIEEPGIRRRLNKCTTDACTRLKSTGSTYCCGQCAHADENRHEIDMHTDECTERWAQRKELLK